MTNAQVKYKIKCLEDVIKNKESRGADAKYEKKLVKAWKRGLKKDENRNKR